MPFDEATEAAIERLYRGDELTVAAIAERYGCSSSAICRLARSRGWPMRWERMGRTPRKSLPSAPKVRAAVAAKLCDAITRKLERMEKGMDGGEPGSEDFERDAKAVASMIGGLEKVTAVPDADQERKPAQPAHDAAETERLHREIMERFERIQRRRNAEAGPK